MKNFKHYKRISVFTMVTVFAALFTFLGPVKIEAESMGNICSKVHSCFLNAHKNNTSNYNKLKNGKTKFVNNCVKGTKKNPTAVNSCYKKSKMNSTGITIATCQALASCVMPYLPKQ